MVQVQTISCHAPLSFSIIRKPKSSSHTSANTYANTSPNSATDSSQKPNTINKPAESREEKKEKRPKIHQSKAAIQKEFKHQKPSHIQSKPTHPESKQLYTSNPIPKPNIINTVTENAQKPIGHNRKRTEPSRRRKRTQPQTQPHWKPAKPAHTPTGRNPFGTPKGNLFLVFLDLGRFIWLLKLLG